jgi:hypothetical protein
MTVISKSIMNVAHSFQKLTDPSIKISKKQEQTLLEEFIAKLSFVLHNLFTRRSFNIDLDNTSVNKVILDISMQLMGTIEQYQQLQEVAYIPAKKVIIKINNIYLEMIIKVENHVLTIQLQENKKHFWFAQSELLFKINLKEPNVINKYSNIVNKVLTRVTKLPYNKLRLIESILSYKNNIFTSHYNESIELKNNFMDHYNADLQKNVPADFLQLYQNNQQNKQDKKQLSAEDITKINKTVSLFFRHNADNVEQGQTMLQHIFNAIDTNNIPTL